MEHARQAWKGFLDSWRIIRPISYVVSSPGVLNRVLQCMVVTGALFLGSIFVFNQFISPVLRHIGGSVGTYYIESAFEFLCNLLWLYPVYIVSFVLTTFWVQDIFDAAFAHFYGSKLRRLQPLTLAQLLSYLVRRIVMIAIFQIQCALLSLLPFPIGRLIEIVHYSLLHSYYCFEYITMALNMGLDKSVEVFEYRWDYFLGFGLSFTACIITFPGITSAGVFCFLFPFLVLTSVPAEVDLNKKQRKRLPIFSIALSLTNKVFNIIV